MHLQAGVIQSAADEAEGLRPTLHHHRPTELQLQTSWKKVVPFSFILLNLSLNSVSQQLRGRIVYSSDQLIALKLAGRHGDHKATMSES